LTVQDALNCGAFMMNFDLMAFLQSALFLFAIVDPVGGVSIFVGLTEGTDDNERRRVLRFAVLTAFLLVVVFALLGSVIMTYVFRISMGEFTFAGGLLLAVVGIRDMVAGHHGIKAGSLEEGQKQRSLRLHALAVSPIAIPLLAGPGTIVTVILFQGQDRRFFNCSDGVRIEGATPVRSRGLRLKGSAKRKQRNQQRIRDTVAALSKKS